MFPSGKDELENEKLYVCSLSNKRTILIGHVNVFNQFRLFWNLIVFGFFNLTFELLFFHKS
jgi:hypothetical protein